VIGEPELPLYRLSVLQVALTLLILGTLPGIIIIEPGENSLSSLRDEVKRGKSLRLAGFGFRPPGVDIFPPKQTYSLERCYVFLAIKKIDLPLSRECFGFRGV